MNLNSESWRLLEKTITTSSITKTIKGGEPSHDDYQYHQNSSNQQEVQTLRGKPEEDIRSVSSYYKEEFKPTPKPRVPQPATGDIG